MMNENGPVPMSNSNPGKGTVTRPPNDGTLWQDNDNKDVSVVRGDAKGFGDAGSNTGMDPGAPIWADGMSFDKDATNRVDGFGSEAKSDPMFDRFKPEETSMADIDANLGTGSESPDKVSSTALDGAKSDPMFEQGPQSEADEDEGNKKSSAGGNSLDVA